MGDEITADERRWLVRLSEFGVAMGSVVVGVGLAFGARKAKFTGIDHVESSCSAALIDSFHSEGW